MDKIALKFTGFRGHDSEFKRQFGSCPHVPGIPPDYLGCGIYPALVTIQHLQ